MGSATGSTAPSQPRLLAIIELQNAIAAAAMNADEVMHIVAERAGTLTSAAAAMVALVEGDDLVVSHRGRGWHGSAAGPACRGRERGGPLRRRAPRAADRRRGDDPAGRRRGRSRRRPASIACVPLLYGETAVGVLEVVSARAAAFTEEDVETLRVLGQIIAIALHRAYTYPRPRYDSLHDALTGLGNRRAFDERIDAELNRNRRFGHSFSLALVKLAGLETAIDRLGQAAGDEMLREVATILKQHTRMIDALLPDRAPTSSRS